MVIFRSSEGKAGYHQAEGLEEAVRFVERLRNSENVEQARIFRMEEVSFEYRPYFRVEVGAPGAAVPAVAPAPQLAPTAVASAEVDHAAEPVDAFEPPSLVDDHVGDEVAAGVRRGLFSR